MVSKLQKMFFSSLLTAQNALQQQSYSLIHILIAEAAVQGANLLIRSSLVQNLAWGYSDV